MHRKASDTGQAALALLMVIAGLSTVAALGFRARRGDHVQITNSIAHQQAPSWRPPSSAPAGLIHDHSSPAVTGDTPNAAPDPGSDAPSTGTGLGAAVAGPTVPAADAPAARGALSANSRPADSDVVASGNGAASASPTASGDSVASNGPIAVGIPVNVSDLPASPPSPITNPAGPGTNGRPPLPTSESPPKGRPVSCAADPSVPGVCALGAHP